MKKYNYISAVFFLILSGYIFYETSTYKIGAGGQDNPALWPRFLAVCMVILSIALIIETIFKKPEAEENVSEAAEHGSLMEELSAGHHEDRINWTSPGMKRAYLAILMVAIFVVVMNLFGMLVGILLLCPGIMFLMSCRNKIAYIILPVCVTAFVYVFFVKIMTITLPGGKFF